MRKRVVITGISLVSPIGSDIGTFWNNLTHGRSGISKISGFDVSEFTTQIGGEVKDVNLSEEIDAQDRRRMSRASQLAVVAAKRSLRDSGLIINDSNSEYVDVFMGIAAPCMDTLAKSTIRRHTRGPRGASPFTPAVGGTPAPGGNVAIALGARGETITVSTGCSSSTNAIGHAFRRIRYGMGTIAFAGGADVGIQAEFLACYGNANMLSTRNNEPTEASRPFDANRDGQVLSEAAGMLVLEDYEHAISRGAQVYAEIRGYGNATDAESMVSVSDNIEIASKALKKTMEDAEWTRVPDYYCAHGSSMQNTDRRETRTLKNVFRRDVYKIPVSSIKSMTGHPFGASGVLQAATCALSIANKEISPTINYRDPDPSCDLDYVPNEGRQAKVERALAYSLGMGGNNSALAFSSC